MACSRFAARGGDELERSPRVRAVVLTYAAPDSLNRCLAAIAAQTRPPDSVTVVDNASPQPANPAAIDLPVEIVRLETNTGPAGGHAEGLDRFQKSADAFAWVMDDDCVPQPDCLERLLTHSSGTEGPSIVLPWWIDAATGEGKFYPAWCGFVVPREVVEAVGLPRRELVWWTEDTEYLSWRMRQAGIGVEWERNAVVIHERVRDGGRRPVWKVYYEARNTVFYRLHVQEGSLPYRSRRMLKTLGHLLAQVVVDEDRRIAKIRAYLHGIADGSRQRLGVRVSLDS